MTLTGELETGDVGLEIDGLKPRGDDEFYDQKGSKNSSAIRLNVSGRSK